MRSPLRAKEAKIERDSPELSGNTRGTYRSRQGSPELGSARRESMGSPDRK